MLRRGLVAAGLAGMVAGAATAEWPKGRARPGFAPGVPAYPYQPTNPAVPATVTAVSFPRLVLTGAEVTAPAAVPPVVTELPPPLGLVTPTPRPPVAFQVRQTRLQVDHCFLTRPAVTLYPDGRYTVSFRADQNPRPGTDVRSPLQPDERLATALQTEHLRRNLFVVKVRGYGAYPVKDDKPTLASSKPVLAELPPISFWVQRGEPYTGYVEGWCEAVRRSFDRIDRMEIEFTYR